MAVAYAADVGGLGLALADVVLLFACNERFAPYFSVALQSVVEHMDRARHYDVVVMTDDIAPQTAATLTRQVVEGSHGAAAIGFLDVNEAFERLAAPKLRTHGHFRRQTYFRLLAPELLRVPKALYLDSDLVVLRDLAPLFDTDVTGRLLAATQDVDTIGQACGYDATVMRYLHRDLGMASELDYFQAGVILFNLDEFRRRRPTAELIDTAARRMWRWADQDVLNMAASDDCVRVDLRWNSLYDWEGFRRARIVAQAPAAQRAAFEAAYADPWVVHYAGPDDRPWLYPRCDRGELFWEYATRSPFLPEIERRLDESRHTARGLLKRAQVFALYRGQSLFDFVFRPGTPARTAIIAGFRAIGGGRLI